MDLHALAYPGSPRLSLNKAMKAFRHPKPKNKQPKTENCSSVRRFTVDQQGDLELQDVAILAEAKSNQLHAANAARFPLGSL